MSDDNELSAREIIAAHTLCREIEDLADQAPWAARLLRPLARLIRWAVSAQQGEA